MYTAISQKTVRCDINEDLLPPVYRRLFYHEVSPLWCIWGIFVALCRYIVIFLVWGR